GERGVGEGGGRGGRVRGGGGGGGMGVRCAKCVLGREAIVADIDESKRKLALDNGAVAAVDPRDREARKQVMELSGGTGVGAAIDFVGAEASSQFGLRSLARGGRLIGVRLFGGALSLPPPVFAFPRRPVMGSGPRTPAGTDG